MAITPNPFEFSFEKIINESNYSFLVQLDQGIFTFKVSKPLDSIYWEGHIDYPQYQKENGVLLMMKKETFFAFIKKGFTSDKFIMTFNDTNLILEFYLEIGLGDFVEKCPLYLNLEKKVKDLSDSVSNIAIHLKKLENKFDQFKNKIEVEIKDCEENTREKIIEALAEFNVANKGSFESLNDEFTRIINRNRSLIKSEVVNPILNNPNPPSNITFSNDNKTIEKINQTSWIGIRYSPIPANHGIFEFSVSLDNVSANCHVMVGFCLESHNGSSGFYSSNCLGMLYLNSGYVYSNIGNHVHNKIKGSKGLIFTSVIDIDSKIIYFKLNGFVITLPVQIKLEEEDKDKICPCVDMYEVGDKVSLIDDNGN